MKFLTMYDLEFSENAKKFIKKLPANDKKKIKSKLETLAKDPDKLKNNIKKLKGEYGDFHRLRISNYRLIYKRYDERLVIYILKAGHRKNIY